MDGSSHCRPPGWRFISWASSAAWMVRKETSGYRQRIAQHSFFACLPLMAVITVIGQFLCLTTWPLSAATLGVMIVTAVGDFEPRASAN